MPTFQIRGIFNGQPKVVNVERETAPTDDEAKELFDEAMLDELEKQLHPEMAMDEGGPAGSPGVSPSAASPVSGRPTPGRPEPDRKLNGRKFDGLFFQCSSCGSSLGAVFKDGYLQISPCPTCLGEMEKVVEATKRFLEKKK